MRFATLLMTAVFSVGLLASPAGAGVFLVSVSESYSDPGRMETSTVYLERDRMRVETKGPEEDGVLIFRRDKGTFWMIDRAEGTYMEMTQESMRRMQESIQEQMKEAMKDLSPEERKMMEGMGMGMRMGQPMPFEPPKTVYKKVASGVRVGRWTCDKYQGYSEGEKTEDVCAADLAQLGLSPDDFRILEEVQKFTEGLAGGGGQAAPKGWQEEQGYPGLPVREVSYTSGRMDKKTEVREIRRQNFSPSLFELPRGLKKAEQPSFGGMGPGMER